MPAEEACSRAHTANSPAKTTLIVGLLAINGGRRVCWVGGSGSEAYGRPRDLSQPRPPDGTDCAAVSRLPATTRLDSSPSERTLQASPVSTILQSHRHRAFFARGYAGESREPRRALGGETPPGSSQWTDSACPIHRADRAWHGTEGRTTLCTLELVIVDIGPSAGRMRGRPPRPW
jgi:hypothetical protein